MIENAKPLLKNILSSAEDFIESKQNGITLRFGHDGNIIPLAALLHLENCYNNIYNPMEVYKVWSNFKIVPMAGNIQIVFYRNKQNDILVKFLLHEKETVIPPVKSDLLPYYHWKDIKAYLYLLLKD